MKARTQIKYSTEIKWAIKKFIYIGFIVLGSLGIINQIFEYLEIRNKLNNENSATQLFLTDTSLNSHQFYETFQLAANNVALDVFENYYNKTRHRKCAPYPHILDLEYQNTNWQRFLPNISKPEIIIDMLNAYYDDRPKLQHPVVRIISAINVNKPNFEIHCQMWFKDDLQVKVTSVQKYIILWYQSYIFVHSGTFMGFIITCPLPDSKNEAPLSVSLVRNECDKATNNLKVHNIRPEPGTVKNDFAVCVKAIDFPHDDASLQLIQFLEINFMFGVHAVKIYSLQMHQNMMRVLNYYQNFRQVEIIPSTLPGAYPNQPYLRNLLWKERELNSMLYEAIVYNDCFYRNMYLYRYIILIDTDEVFIPKHNMSYKEMLDRMPEHTRNYSSYYCRNKMFVNNQNRVNNPTVPEHLNMLQITTKATDYGDGGRNPKSFFNTEDLIVLDNHTPKDCFSDCKNYEIKETFGQLHHYRASVPKSGRFRRTNGFHVVHDGLLLQYKDKLINLTNVVLKELNLL